MTKRWRDRQMESQIVEKTVMQEQTQGEKDKRETYNQCDKEMDIHKMKRQRDRELEIQKYRKTNRCRDTQIEKQIDGETD